MDRLRGFPEDDTPKFQDSLHMKVIRLSSLNTQKIFLVLISLLEAESTSEPSCGRKVYVNEKFPMIPTWIEPATFRLVSQCRIIHHAPCSSTLYNLPY